ncbi:hypothetical protein AZE42_00814 [Rhizopogon vesiculosus]|uniref:Uncharacterized protein n=1 Tax=Rhizopogon vesiculosus TaxID=180088 RepID=A0A1J8QAZ9_9AGAM|nr:hypothetical protein AZE42_00814 [Rhizopogon vesiculosus]
MHSRVHSDSSHDTSVPSPLPHPPHQASIFTSAFKKVVHHFKKHVGVGVICAVGYFDPLLLHDHPKHPRLVRRFVLYPLYALCEIAIISTDLAELLGSAVGLTLLFPNLSLWSAVLLTGVDVFVFLIIGDPSRTGRPVRLFEVVIIILVCAKTVHKPPIAKVHPDWQQIALGFVPSKGLLQTQPNAIYTAIGIIGATVMPHALFLGSNLATQDRVSQPPQPLPPPVDTRRSSFLQRLQRVWTSTFYISRSQHNDTKDLTTSHEFRTNNSMDFIRSHLGHGTADVILSLLGLAVPINSAILILSATMFYTPGNMSSIGLYNMHSLMLQNLGKGAAFLFALSLVCSGQTASVTATLAGQIVSEGFILWKISPFIRRLLTRLISLIPSMIVAISSGESGINALLIASQVALSVVLPFVAFPLIYLTSSKTVMAVKTPKLTQEKLADDSQIPSHPVSDTLHKPPLPVITCITTVERKPGCDDPIKHPSPQEYDIVDFSSGYLLTTVAYAIWVVILMANVYAIAMLGMGNTGP